MGMFAHANNEDQIVEGAGHGTKPYLSPGLSGAYKHRHWTIEIIMGCIIGFLGGIFIIIHYATQNSDNPNQEKAFFYAGVSFATFGGLLILLGLCWYKNLQKAKQDEEGTATEMNSLNTESAMTQQTALS